MTRYSREDVLRILHLQPRQLLSWERVGLVEPLDSYDFGDLSQLLVLRGLRRTRISSKNIHTSISAMQRVSGVRNPLREASAVRHGSRLAFRHAGALVDPISQQLAFDFALSSTADLGIVGRSESNPLLETAQVQELFLRAIQLEEAPATIEQAAELYRQILHIRPAHAPASINLGTIHYNRREFEQAEQFYRQATVADSTYALAFFDLGNVLDETMHLEEAINAYQRAILLVPQYADAHYNLALAYERQGERRRALRHWLTYVRLDPIGPWASHAKCQARKILSTERLSIVSRRAHLVPIAG